MPGNVNRNRTEFFFRAVDPDRIRPSISSVVRRASNKPAIALEACGNPSQCLMPSEWLHAVERPVCALKSASLFTVTRKYSGATLTVTVGLRPQLQIQNCRAAVTAHR